MKIDVDSVILGPDQAMRIAIEVIDNSGLKIALITDDQHGLLGVVTDGDIRRALLAGHDLESKISTFMHKQPRTASYGTERRVLLERLRQEQILHLPIVDEKGQVRGLAYLPQLEQQTVSDTEVVIMAGGLGTRLRPLTEKVPKPLVSVGGRPLIDTIIDKLVEQGFTNITLCVNYLGHMLEEHLGDGSGYGANIRFVRENQRMGTAGALSLLSERPASSFIVMNGDILSNVDFNAMLEFHRSNNALATMALKTYTYEVPFGVVEVESPRIVALREKPKQSFLVNAGIYIVEPSVLDYIPGDEFFDITSLFDELLEKQLPVIAFPLREQWLDIGRPEDLAIANSIVDDQDI